MTVVVLATPGTVTVFGGDGIVMVVPGIKTGTVEVTVWVTAGRVSVKVIV